MENVTDLIGAVEACAILDVDRSTLSRWSDERLSPEHRRLDIAMRLPGKTGAVLFHRAAVERLAAERHQGSPSRSTRATGRGNVLQGRSV